MMRQKKHIWIYASVLFVTLFAWSICLAQTQKIQRLEDAMELRYPQAEVTLKQVKKLQTGEAESDKKLIKEVLAWEQTTEQNLKNKDLDKETQGNKIEVYGATHMILPSYKLTGKSLYQGDLEGAIITEPVAHALWGSSDVIGKKISLGNKDYVVRGILKDKSKSVIVQADDQQDEMKFSALRMQFINPDNIEEQFTTLNFKYNLPNGIMNNLSLKSILLSYLALIPGYVLGFYGLIKLYYFIYKNHKYWVSALVLSAIAVGITLLIGTIIQFSFYLPSYMIPNQWSDFDFWAKTWEKLLSNKETIQALPSFWPDTCYKEIQTLIIGSFGITLGGCMILIRKMKIKEGKELFLISLISITMSFMSILLLYRIGEEAIATSAFWCIIPIYFGIDFIVNKWNMLLE